MIRLVASKDGIHRVAATCICQDIWCIAQLDPMLGKCLYIYVFWKTYSSVGHRFADNPGTADHIRQTLWKRPSSLDRLGHRSVCMSCHM